MARLVQIYVHSGHQLLDLAGPLDAFHAANEIRGKPTYELKIVSRGGGDVIGNAGAVLKTDIVAKRPSDTLIVVGGDVHTMSDPSEAEAVRREAREAQRIAAVCTGAFLLGAAGLLDGKKATTHWACARRLQQLYPKATVDSERIFTVDGNVWTSAGVTAGIDLALALIEADCGLEVARATARELVVYHRRPGGQSQFSAPALLDPSSERMRLVIDYARGHLSEELSIEKLAEIACLSSRQFGRVFFKETGETPAKAVERLRVEAANVLLQDGFQPVEVIARKVGFHDPERMRRAFIKRFGHPPQAIRRLSVGSTSVLPDGA